MCDLFGHDILASQSGHLQGETLCGTTQFGKGKRCAVHPCLPSVETTTISCQTESLTHQRKRLACRKCFGAQVPVWGIFFYPLLFSGCHTLYTCIYTYTQTWR